MYHPQSFVAFEDVSVEGRGRGRDLFTSLCPNILPEVDPEKRISLPLLRVTANNNAL